MAIDTQNIITLNIFTTYNTAMHIHNLKYRYTYSQIIIPLYTFKNNNMVIHIHTIYNNDLHVHNL